MKPFNIHIHTAERDFYNGECLSVIVPLQDGQYGIMANHRNMIGAIEPGTMEISLPDEDKKSYIISRGMVKVEDGDVLILAENVFTYEELDELEEKKAKEAIIEKEISQRSRREYIESEVALRQAIYRLKKKRDSGFNE